MIIVIVFYLILGMFMDAFSIMITTIPVILPVVKALHIDLVWFGVIAVVLTEAGLISPPFGLNLFVIQGLRKKQAKGGTIRDVYIGVLPFFGMMLLEIVLLMLFPEIALWLPQTMMGR